MTLRLTPFDKVLVANRGEIALRVMRTARALGYRTVAVYSTADANACHVRAADQAVCIGEPLAAQSYLRIDAIIEAARRTGADAVHPGYGFLAENAAFARACSAAGLVFIGPSAASIVAMGDKAAAKRTLLAAGVPCIPGYASGDESGNDDGQSENRLVAAAARIGYPVMIKATAGGGGRGMRRVEQAAEFVEQLRSAQSEAKNAFGVATVILERALVDPRHIEIQVVADRYGHAIHLGERDCSVQRRHQKLIEEAPSPAVSAALRERMGRVARDAVQAIGYEGVGTLEFLLDRSGEFFFMEMNTRLQVEHPVTEAITGLDLVELQFRVAAGEPLALTQADVTFSGHAIEVRLCAEDARRAFMPQSGTLALWQMSAHIRVEHALHTGAEILPFYDSMIAKVIGHGATRDEARRKLSRGLEDLAALGVTTNQAFLGRCLAHPVFADGEATTAFVEQNLADLLHRDPETEARAIVLAAALLLETHDGAMPRSEGRRLTHGLPINQHLRVDGTPGVVSLVQRGQHRYDADLEAAPPGGGTEPAAPAAKGKPADHAEGRRFELDLLEVSADTVRFSCDGLSESAAWARDGARLLLRFRGESFDIEDRTRAAAARPDQAGGRDGTLRASMNGRVVVLRVGVGNVVEAGAPILTLEAMKMEHVHVAPCAGVVKTLTVALGDQVPAGRVIAEIEAAGAPT